MADLTDRVTAILKQAGVAPDRAADQLMPLVYDELRRIAAGYLGGGRNDRTLQPTAVVHEAYLRMVDQTRVDWQGRTHFLAVSATVMRRILVDHARQRMRIKRGGEWQRVTLERAGDLAAATELGPEELIDIDDVLGRLASLDPRQAQIVELRFFGGLTHDEIAEHLGVSRRTVLGHWAHARAWMRREMERRRPS